MTVATPTICYLKIKIAMLRDIMMGSGFKIEQSEQKKNEKFYYIFRKKILKNEEQAEYRIYQIFKKPQILIKLMIIKLSYSFFI